MGVTARLRPPKRWLFQSEGIRLELPADLPNEGELRPVRYTSTWQIFKHAIGIYRREFRTIAAILLIPATLGELAAYGAHESHMQAVEAAAWWIATVVAFAPLMVATSDVCIGNRPSVRRSYRHAGWKAVLRVIAGSALVTLFLAIPVGLAWGVVFLVTKVAPQNNDLFDVSFGCGAVALVTAVVATVVCFLVWSLYVPLICVVEPRVPLHKVIARSRRLGRGYANRSAAVALIIGAIFGLAAGVHQFAKSNGVELLGIVAARLLDPVPYIAATLIYYDLRARKEGYGVAERLEDLE